MKSLTSNKVWNSAMAGLFFFRPQFLAKKNHLNLTFERMIQMVEFFVFATHDYRFTSGN